MPLGPLRIRRIRRHRKALRLEAVAALHRALVVVDFRN
jgi:hypothetical protein